MTHVSGFPPAWELAIKKILVFRFSSLGDIILTTPLLKILRKNYPDAQIDYCTKKSYSDLLKYNPAVSRVLEVSDDMDFAELRLLKKTLINEKYDLVIDLHNNLRTFYLRLSLRLGTYVVVFKKYSFKKFLLVKFKINRMKDLPSIAQRYIDTIKHIIDVNTIELTPEIKTNDYAKEEADKIISGLNIPANSKLICIVPSSKHFTKTYPAENYIDLINKFDRNKFSFILTGKGTDKNNIDRIKSETGENVFNLCDKLSLPELYEVMKKCNLVISGDTGPMHIAEAAGVPIIMLAGSSVKEFGFYPINEKNTILEIDGLSCRPCSHIGKDYCPKGHFKCMKEITAEMVYKKVILKDY